MSITHLDILIYLIERSPFTSCSVLHNLASGMTAESSVNVVKSKEVGQTIHVRKECKLLLIQKMQTRL